MRGSEPINTIYSKKYIWKQFQEFLQVKKYTLDQSTQIEEISNILEDWAFNMRKKNGANYKECTITGIDIEVKAARDAKNSKREQLQISPNTRKVSATALTLLDTSKMVSVCNEDTPDGLQKKFFLIASFELAWRGGEGARCLREYFQEEMSNDGSLARRIRYNPIITKTTHGGSQKCAADKWLAPNKNNKDVCLIRLYKKLTDHISKDITCKRLFLKANPNWTNPKCKWYYNVPIGNPISKWTSSIANIAGLDTAQTKITNHSNRAIAVSTLAKAGINAQELIKITGHTSTSSIKPYLQLDKQYHKNLINNLRSANIERGHTHNPPQLPTMQDTQQIPNMQIPSTSNSTEFQQITITNQYNNCEGCVEKPLATLWRNYTQSSRPDVRMQLTVSGGGLKATTRDHGLTEYWANRLTSCAAPAQFPRLFCWVYRHEGRRLRHELRCHAVLCSSAMVARQIETKLKESLALALNEFRRDKISKQNARLSLVNSVYDNPTIPRRKILLSTGSTNYRPPLERSKSAPKLTIIEENLEEDEEIFEGRPRNPTLFLKHCDSSSALAGKRNSLRSKLISTKTIYPIIENEYGNDFEDQNGTLILEKLVGDNFAAELLESCNMNGWLRNYENPDDEGSLSSGCESASTVTSDTDQSGFNTIIETEESEDTNQIEHKKTELDFKVGGCVLSRVKSFENADIRKFCGLKTNINNNLLDNDEVSLIPVGETQPDFSSLKVFKKRCMSEPERTFQEEEDGSEEENASACSDESGYDEAIDCASSVANIVLV